MPETTRRHVHAFHHLREMDMPFAPHPLKLTLSLNVALTMIVHQKWPAFRKVARTHVCQPIHASKGNNVMSYPHHLADPLLHALALMDSCPTTKDTAYQVCLSFLACLLIFVCLTIPFLVEAAPQCNQDYECQDREICHLGSCQLACRFQTCGTNAECSTRNHVASCACLHGYEGNPQSACYPRKYT